MDTRTEESYPDLVVPALGYQLAGLTDRRSLLAATQELLDRLIPSEEVAWNAVDREAGTAEVVGAPYLEDPEIAALLMELDDHPMIKSFLGEGNNGSMAPRRFTDVTSMTDLRRTRTYNELLRPLGLDMQMSIPTARFGAAGGRAWTFARHDRDFTDRELELARMLQPVLAMADRAYPAPRDEPDLAATERLGLTRREVEILHLVARGLTADACGRALRIATGTVRKHLENAYAKLGTHDRLMAVEKARLLGILPAQ